MKPFLLLAALALLPLPPAHAAPKPKKNETGDILPVYREAVPRLIEYEGGDLSEALRTLANEAKINLVVDNTVSGTLTMRLENQTARDALLIIARAKNLFFEAKDGIFFVRSKNPPPAESIADAFTPGLIKFYDAILDYQARPETAQKLARAKKVLYDALIAEGFTKDEALRIILASQDLPVPNPSK